MMDGQQPPQDAKAPLANRSTPDSPVAYAGTGSQPGATIQEPGECLCVAHVSEREGTAARSEDHAPNSSAQKQPAEYWLRALADCESVSFPILPISHGRPSADRVAKRIVSGLQWLSKDVTKTTAIRAAWALVTSRLTNSKDVVFGAAVTRHSSDLDKATDRTVIAVPIRIKLEADQSIPEYLRAVWQQEMDMVSFEQFDLQSIIDLSPETKQACTFQTLLAISETKSHESHGSHSESSDWLDSQVAQWSKTYALVLEVQSHVDQTTFTAHYDSGVLEIWMVEKLLEQVELAVRLILDAGGNESVSNINIMSKRDLEEIWNWNSVVPASIERCVHEMIKERVIAQPKAPAVCAWDGELTYGELDQLATALAGRLAELGIGPEVVVPLCFEKSVWTTVAILGVLKTGAAFLLLDISLPEHRLQAIVNQANASILISSHSNKTMTLRLAEQVITVDSQIAADAGNEHRQLTSSNPLSAIYMVFTSGSTGVPKGIIITHQNVASALVHQQNAWSLGVESRVFDFASYSYDISICNVLATLVAGGCLCVPNEQQRLNKLAETMVFFEANTVILTPSVGRLLSPEQVPTLQSIVFIGEALKLTDASPWWGKTQIVNTYGPSECPCLSLGNINPSSLEDVIRIGKGLGQVTWVVDPDNHESLLSPGCIGELLLEGPLVGRGYLGDVEKTAAAFIENPSWLLQGTESHVGRRGRLYKTGDLVRYNNNGSLTYLGRKDNQVKIRGQRVELAEVEYWVQKCMPHVKQIVAETIILEGSTSGPVLAAFLNVNVEDEGVDEVKMVTIPTERKAFLVTQLPKYMVPAVFFSITQLPMTATGKINRGRLRDIGGSFSVRQLAEMQTSESETKKEPISELELQVRNVWAAVLSLDSASISLEDSFFSLGGDSISAMKTVGKAYEVGITFTVADMFNHPKLKDLCLSCLIQGKSTTDSILPFSLLGENYDRNLFLDGVSEHYQLNSATIQDAYPCTPLQEGLFSLSSRRPGDYIVQTVVELPPSIVLEQLHAALQELSGKMSLLRTRIIQHDNLGIVQVVLDEPMHWFQTTDLQCYLEADKKKSMELGQALIRYALVNDTDGRRLVWTMHHAIYDGWSMDLIMEALRETYLGNAVDPGPTFSSFIKYINGNDPKKATDYWRTALVGYEGAPFPASLPSSQTPLADKTVQYNFPKPELEQHSSDITTSSLIRAAWAMVVASMTSSEDVAFGTVVSGRNAPIAGIDIMAAPTFATVPLRIKPTGDQTVLNFLQTVQQQATDMIPFEQAGLRQIASTCAGAQQACMFQTLLIVQPDARETDHILSNWQINSEYYHFNTYGLVLEVQLGPQKITATASFDSRLIDAWIVDKLLTRLRHVMEQLAHAHPAKALTEIQVATVEDLEQTWQWNSTVPIPVERCIHDMIKERVLLQPNSQAVCAWDGEITYGELDRLSTGLADQLAGLGIGPEMMIPLCFEKSMWVTVAVLGVLKAGAAFLLLDPSLPETRLQTIVGQVKANIVVCSSATNKLGSRLAPRIVVVNSDLSVASLRNPQLKSHDPLSAMYAIFTSGSTGIPKGTVISHQNLASALFHQQKSLKLGPDSRVFDFVSYSFDMSICNIFATLIAGGCFCVPRDDHRLDSIAESIAGLEANTVILTPSVARLISPEEVPQLRTIIFAGEPLHVEDVRRWWNRDTVNVINVYGPSECTPISTLNIDSASPEQATRVGKGIGQVTWVVDPKNHNNLLPLGCAGELILEGPLVGRGYLNAPEMTSEAFIKDPLWLLQGSNTRKGRRGTLYKTGDLVKYNDDGSLSFLGRKDNQVKVRGQRVELLEVEYWVRKGIPDARQVVAEVITPQGSTAKPILAVFLCLGSVKVAEKQGDCCKVEIFAVPTDTEDWLLAYLPSYMVPSVFFAMNQLPMTTTGKMDRKKLREIGGSMSIDEIAKMQTEVVGSTVKQKPVSATEKHIQTAWASVLGLELLSIGLEDSFFRLGGDSIAAMKVVGHVRKAGIKLTVADIFRHPKLRNLSKRAIPTGDNITEHVAPFSLLSKTADAASFLDGISGHSLLNLTKICDAYPCTPLQEGLMALALKRPGDYVMQAVFELSPEASHNDLRLAWEKTVSAMPILRTRIAQHDSLGLVQVVLDENIHWMDAIGGIDKYLAEDKNQAMELGQSLTRYALVKDNTKKCKWFVWTIHHAIYDGWSMHLIMNALSRCHRGESVDQVSPFSAFIKYTRALDEDTIAEYWKTALADCECSPFPNLLTSARQPVADKTTEYRFPPAQVQLNQHLHSITASTLIRAAWGMIASRMTNSDDVVFGAVVSGRNAPVVGIDSIVGPTFATVPVRVKSISSQKVAEYLQMVQKQATDMIPFEQIGIHRIAKMGPGAQQACLFQTLLVIQPDDTTETHDVLGKWQGDDHLQRFSTYGLTILIQLGNKETTVSASYDSQLIDGWLVDRLLRRLELVMNQLAHAAYDSILADINISTIVDLEDIWEWNSTVPVSIKHCVHEAIRGRVLAQPTAMAVAAWDGNLSYFELDELATRLAGQLIGRGIGPDMIVPLCFEKSLWTTVAILGVLKAGAAFVLLDSSLPEHRLQSIIGQVDATLIISSVLNQDLCYHLLQDVLVIDQVSLSEMLDHVGSLPNVDPDSTACVIFTSGSTGIPKGAALTHANACSAIHYQSNNLTCTAESRIFDFSSYGFDVAVLNAFMTLVVGGCLCVPSDEERRGNLVESIASSRADIVVITPSVARLLDPEKLPDLRVIVFAGEALRVKDVEPWVGHSHIINTYGPSECTCISTVNLDTAGPAAATRIGKGLGQVTWIVDPENHNSLLPPGCVGELLLEGPLVGRGYLNDADKTADHFINDPQWLLQGTSSHTGRQGRLYKTGDLVRYDNDGSLTFVGRKDDQVKIRGQRVELGEVEHWVQQCVPHAKQVLAEIVVPQGDNSSPILVAFLQIDSAARANTEQPNALAAEIMSMPSDTEDWLAAHLPSYMLPSVFFSIQEIPMTATGKIDRRRIREIGGAFSAKELASLRTAGADTKRQPVSAVEKLIQGAWAKVLSLAPTSIGLDDSFFKLGGDSIAAMKVVGELRKMGISLTVADVFRHPKLHSVATQATAFTPDTSKTILPTPYSEMTRQSFAQERIWFMEQLHPGLAWYLMPRVLRLRGPLQLNALHAALLCLEQRHESLRTVFGTENGVNVQYVQPFHPTNLRLIHVPLDQPGDLVNLLQKEQETLFNLEKDPGWRVSVYKIDEGDHVLCIMTHHIIFDGWSFDVVRRELGLLYSAALRNHDLLSQVDPLPIQYRDYSIWQRQQEQLDEHERQLDYWVKQLETSRPATFLCDKPRPAALSGHAEVQELKIEGSLYDDLQKFCKVQGVTPFVVLLAAFRAAHYRLTGVSDATVGTVNANRDRWEVKDLIGFLVNMQCIRISIHDDSFEDLVQQVKATTIASLANQDVPFESVVSKLNIERDLSRHPLAQVGFALHSQLGLENFSFEGVQTEMLESPATTRLDLEFHFYREENAFLGNMIFSTDLYHAGTIKNILSVFDKTLRRGLAEPATPVALLPLLNSDDYASLNDMGLIQIDSTSYPRDSSLVDIFQQQALAHPNRLAVKDHSSQLTYAQLDEKSDVLSQWLSRRRLSAETLIGVIAGRSCETVVALLGILKANLAYLPLDLKTPLGRLNDVLSSLPGDKLVLLGPSVEAPALEIRNVEFVTITAVLDVPESGKDVLKGSTEIAMPSATSLAYVMFTSGSTGKPKGVMVEHRGIVRLTKQSNMVQHLPAHPVIAHITSISFDISTFEIFVGLLNGGTLICIEAASILDFAAIPTLFAQERIQVLVITPALLKQYIVHCPNMISQLKMLYAGGDRLDTSDLRIVQGLMEGKIANGYGPTENTVASTLYYLSEHDQFVNGVPIGRAISNSGAYVMDARQRLVPLGVVGELVVTGDGLARGYTDPKQNIDRFVYVTIDGERVRAYRTGDYVRWHPVDGELDFFGRMDGQVKVRGHRVELGEIEHILRTHESIADAVTVFHYDGGQTQRIISFVTLKNENNESNELQQVEMWEERFDADTYTPFSEVRLKTIGRDFIGWTSMYDGRKIDTGEMNEWLDDAIKTILNGGLLGDVIEVGTGSGMILFGLMGKLRSYVGLEPSARAVGFVTETVKSVPALANKVKMYKATAAELGRVETPVAYGIAILNSVIQYFPTQEYLFRVIKDLINMGGIKTLFFGDVRSHSLRKQFLAGRAFRIAGSQARPEEVHKIMNEMEQVESELLVDPGFFTSLSSRIPGVIQHVEILPKKMQATNELSCYRYAAIVHLKAEDIQKEQEQIHEIGPSGWVDFVAQGLNRESLAAQLQHPSNQDVIAISNIPHSKSILERDLLDLLENKRYNAGSHDNWLSALRHDAENCPALSTVELFEIAEQAGFRVEVSWARQYSQRGGLDAIFHRKQATNGRERSWFHFPTDHESRPYSSLSSHPLRELLARKVEKKLYQILNSRLPSYMIPQEITVLDQMPMNISGKVDRQALAKSVQIKAKLGGLKRQATSDFERQVQAIWSKVLDLELTSIGIDDNFFRLGGDSIAAMRLVGEARKVDIGLTVADIFRCDTLMQLAELVEKTSLNAVDTNQELLQHPIIDPVLKSALLDEIGLLTNTIRPDEVSDILPTTNFQEQNVVDGISSGLFVNYVFIDLKADHDLNLLEKGCMATLERFPILRACFLRLQDKIWQVIPRKLHKLLHVKDIYGDLHQSFDKFCLENLQGVSPSQPLVSFTVLRHHNEGLRFVLRISHAQHDGVCMPIIFQSIMNHSGLEESPIAPSFSSFLSYASHRHSRSVAYWEQLLQGSRYTNIRARLHSQGISHLDSPKLIRVEAEAAVPSVPEKITMATLVSSAWAILLSRLTGEDDVVYGHLIAGRNSKIDQVEEIVGPCVNVVPVRVILLNSLTTAEILTSVQEQFLAIGEADSLGFNDIVDKCTNWPTGSTFDSVVQHQNIDEQAAIHYAGGKSQLGLFQNPNRPPAPTPISIVSYPLGKRIRIVLLTGSHIMETQTANALIGNLVEIIEHMVHQPEAPFGSWVETITLGCS